MSLPPAWRSSTRGLQMQQQWCVWLLRLYIKMDVAVWLDWTGGAFNFYFVKQSSSLFFWGKNLRRESDRILAWRMKFLSLHFVSEKRWQRLLTVSSVDKHRLLLFFIDYFPLNRIRIYNLTLYSTKNSDLWIILNYIQIQTKTSS